MPWGTSTKILNSILSPAPHRPPKKQTRGQWRKAQNIKAHKIMDEQKISVVVCTYNGERFLREQLDSLLAQTRVPDEIIVQDDGSTDGTLRILQEYAARHPIFHILKNVGPHGVNPNFFSALRQATGSLIAICDQDDIWMPTKLEHQAQAMADHLLVGGCSLPFAEDDSTPVDADTRLPNIDLLRMMFVGMMPGHTQMLRRELLDLLPKCEWFMYDLQTQATAAAYERVAFLPETLVRQRRHQAAATYHQPRSRSHSLPNILRSAWAAISLYRQARPHVRHRFREWQKFLAQIPADTPSLHRARRMAALLVADGPVAYLRLTAFCYNHRRRLFHAVEPDTLLTRLRALFFPISCAEYYRYLVKGCSPKKQESPQKN